MLIEYDNTGSIFHVIFDPVPNEVVEFMVENGHQFLSYSQQFEPDVEMPWTDADGNPTTIMVQGPAIPFNPTSDTHYVDLTATPAAVVERPLMALDREVEMQVGDTLVLNDLPDPVEVVLDDQVTELTGGTLELSADMPAEYTLVLNKWPYQPATVKVTVNA
ncbi:hypothetical protein HJA82_29125 [Rhizobium bangladeshense]|uniref:hypothetical protein n=1 Tax=Rhizobium bangladeshense TaxID=1138189 RepID=UPI001C83C93A|nr:hypothetical protein [Rhizobium bangladeshense]MBX4911377.1 hypothetical protein [Rhizobium bangladeshense]